MASHSENGNSYFIPSNSGEYLQCRICGTSIRNTPTRINNHIDYHNSSTTRAQRREENRQPMMERMSRLQQTDENNGRNTNPSPVVDIVIAETGTAENPIMIDNDFEEDNLLMWM